ncbi:MAG: methionyl-tRNA formyltransferase [Planctomycetes bacterium]|nr:methionyl-tRNA formyltransferase [Planctomycetota bacterium]MBL7144303.1 methionyl-tRNA formyltransferase [Phycisphaerae bacterium]
MKIIYLGSGEFGIACLNALKSSAHSVQLVVTQPPNPAGRGRKPNPTPAARWANTNSIPFVETDNANTPEMIEKIADYEPDLIVVIAFGQKVGNDLINLPPKSAVNVHASLLPKYRGAAPINWAIINGETETGISIITLAQKMDAGCILGQSKTDIAPDETAGSLHDKLAQIAAPLLLKTIDQIDDGSVVYTEQDHSKATLAPKLSKSDGFIDFNESAASLEKKIRGLWPWPSASANYLSKKTGKSVRVSIAAAQVVETINPPGLSAGILDENLNVTCGKDALRIVQIKPAGSPLMDFKDFTNGRQTQPADLFIRIDK